MHPIKGRGTSWSIQHRFEPVEREPYDDGWAEAGFPDGPAPAPTEVFEERVRSILAENDSPDLGFELSVNPYRGCEHGCIYCYARPTHSYLNLSPGIDFETRIIAKVNAGERLRAALSARGYRPRIISVGSATDAYQPAERRLRITRTLLEVLHEARHPFSMFTKSSLIERDLDLIVPMSEQRLAAISITLTTLDPALARVMEPRAAAPARRLRIIEALARAGVAVGVSVSPVIPFLNEPELERVLQAARDAGASSGWSVVIRLPWEVNPLFQRWLEQHFPDRAARVMARIRDMRGGRDYDGRFGTRMCGTGTWAELLRQRFEKCCARIGLARRHVELDLEQFRPPTKDPAQPALF